MFSNRSQKAVQMFSKILKSAARKKLFEILFNDKKQKYYLRQLSEMLQYSAGSLQRELTNLVADGFLTTEMVGNMKFFTLNKKNPMVHELKKYMEREVSHESDGIHRKVVNPEKNDESEKMPTKNPNPKILRTEIQIKHHPRPELEVIPEPVEQKNIDPVRIDIL